MEGMCKLSVSPVFLTSAVPLAKKLYQSGMWLTRLLDASTIIWLLPVSPYEFPGGEVPYLPRVGCIYRICVSLPLPYSIVAALGIQEVCDCGPPGIRDPLAYESARSRLQAVEVKQVKVLTALALCGADMAISPGLEYL